MSFEEGSLFKWNDDKGYGFIKPDGENTQVFIHITAFGRIPRRPMEGDRVYFNAIIEEQGKRKAKFARILEVPGRASAASPSVRRQSPPARDHWQAPRHHTSTPRRMKRTLRNFMVLVVLPLALATTLIGRCHHSNRVPRSPASGPMPVASERWNESPPSPIPSSPSPEARPTSNPTHAFRCEGKTHCGQMGSRDEAQFYLNNCPHEPMDGDGDGTACEQQFGH
jgi:cold shock CspA family protein